MSSPLPPPPSDQESAAAARSTLGADARQLAGSSAIYAVGTFAVKGLAFLLLPLYTRYLTPADFGILGYTTALSAALLMVYTLSLHGSVTYLYFNSGSEEDRWRAIGTVWIAMMLIAGAAALALDQIGARLADSLSLSVSFHPYVRLALWIALLNTLGLVSLNLLQIEEKPVQYVALTVCAALATTLFVVWFVVVREEGAHGSLLGTLLGGLVMAAPYAWIVARRIRFVIDPRILRQALAYSFPLIVHGFSAWLLQLSDRVILERFVSLGELGLYSIAYLLASAVYLFGTTINNGLVPIVFRKIAGDDAAAKRDIARLSTYYAAAVFWAALGLALLCEALLWIFTVPAYFPAARIMPWLAAGMLVHTLYLVPVNVLFAKGRTGAIAAATLTSGLVNVALNLWWVPQFGIMGAAMATTVGFTLMLVLVWLSAQRAYELKYEYRRLGKLLAMAGALMVLATAVPFERPLTDALWRAALWMAFPLLLLPLGFYHREELQFARSLLHRAR